MSFACCVLIIVWARPAIKGQLVILIYRRASCLKRRTIPPVSVVSAAFSRKSTAHIHAAASLPSCGVSSAQLTET